MLPVEQPFKIYTGRDGKALNNGYVYFGLPGENPANPAQQVTVYWDAAGTIPAMQPLRTTNGYIVRAGTPANVFFDGAYSELVQDSHQREVFYAPTSVEFSIVSVVNNLIVQMAAFFATLAGATGSALIGFIQAGVGAVLRTVQAELRDTFKPAQFGAVGDGVADDSDAIERCANIGANRIDYCGKSYKITRRINLYTSGVTHDMRGARFVQSTTNTDAFMVGYNGAAFVKTDDTVFIGGSIVGADNGLTTTVSSGIGIYPPATIPYAVGAGCSGVKIIDTKISGFCINIAATGADNIDIDGIYSTNTKYHAAASAGGYGVLMQTCFGIKIGQRNVFKGSATCRHAIYISADPGRTKDANNVCKKVTIGACRVDWDSVTGTTGFEAGIYIRGAFDVSVNGPIISGAYGGLLYDLENAAGENITITGVQSKNIRSTGAGEVAGVGFTRSAGTYRAKNVTVTGCTVQLTGTNTHGLQLAYIDGLTSGGHTIGRETDSYISGIYTVNCNDVLHNPSTIAGNWSSAAMDFVLASDNVQIGKPVIAGVGAKYNFYAVPTNLQFNYPRTFIVTSNGIGTVTVASFESEALTTAVVSEANGFSVTLAASQVPDPQNFSVLSLASQVANVYHRSIAGQVVTFGVLGISAGALAPLPAASNAYAIQITLLH